MSTASYIQEQTSLLLQKTKTAVIVNVVIAFLTYLAIPSPGKIWLWAIITASAVRLLFTLLVKDQADNPGKVQVVFLITLSLIFLQGVAWGYASVFLYATASDLHRFYLLAIICGMSGGAVLTLAPSLSAYSCYTVPAVVPLVVMLLMEPDQSYLHAGLMGVVFLVAVHVLARRISLSHLELIRSQHRLESTSHELEQHKNRLEELVSQRTNELAESRENYRRLSEEINDAIFELDATGKITYISPVITTITGYSPDKLMGVSFAKFIYPEDLPAVRQQFSRVLSGELLPTDYRVIDSEGKPHWVRSSSRPIVGGNGPLGVRGVLSDIENEKRVEGEKEELLRRIYENQKLEAIGTLAGGLAHDFNNILMGIQGHASLMTSKLNSADPNMEHVQAIEEHICSATSLTGQMLGAAHGGKYDPRPIDLNELVQTSSKMFSRTKKEIAVQTHLAPSDITVEVHRQQIEQVLLNLYVNAWQAMPEGGELHLRTATEDLDATACKPYQTVPGLYAKITLRDSGIGMDDEVLSQIFDPFFTTKEKGRGTGLGLASAYGIVKNHDGFITVKSEVGQGTTFNIYLPLSDKEPSREIAEEKHIVKGSETILIVDDEDIIIEVASAILDELGYKVIVAVGGQQALDILATEGEGIDLVILDLIMPGMDGSQTFDRIRKVRPTMPVILSSGYALNDQATQVMKQGCDGFMQKPFSVLELSHKIRGILDHKGTPSPNRD